MEEEMDKNDNDEVNGTSGKGVGSPSPRRRRGKCKWFNVVKGWGFITPDDGGQEIFVHQHAIHMEGFRSLAENEQVEFEAEITDKGLEATFVCAPGGGPCSGSVRTVNKKRVRKIRCYNCGEYGNHVASRCKMGPMPKRCHHCKSEDHLIADCPQRFNKNDMDRKNDDSEDERFSDGPGPSTSKGLRK